MRRCLFLISFGLVSGCAGDPAPADPTSSTTTTSSSSGSGGLPDAGPDADPPEPNPHSPCLERPTDLPRPPDRELPCDLFPPDGP